MNLLINVGLTTSILVYTNLLISMECKVYGTANTTQKNQVLLNNFPKLSSFLHDTPMFFHVIRINILLQIFYNTIQ